MAKRLIEFYQKQSDESFSGPVKIGSSGEYVTLQEGEPKTLKRLSDQIGNPDSLTPNVGVPEANQIDMVSYLNSTNRIANDALTAATQGMADNSIDQRKLKSITLTDTSLEYPTIENGTIGIILGRIKKYLSDLYNKKVNKAGDSITGNITLTNDADILIDDAILTTTISNYLGVNMDINAQTNP